MSIFTIGYEGINIDELLFTLKSNAIEYLIDIREIPISRKKGFSKSALKNKLSENNINYIHIRDLGSPKEIRNEFKETKDWDTFSTKYLLHLNQQIKSIKTLADMMDFNCCLLCFEADFKKCHRSLVARAIQKEISENNLVTHLIPTSRMSFVEVYPVDRLNQLSTIDVEIHALFP